MKRIIWESYFDSSISRKYGRRVRRGFPKDRLFDILNSLNLNYTFQDAKYPKIPWKTEKKIEVEWEESKEKLIKKIIEKAFSDSSGNSR
jgi:signal recognition particle subunit SEC65